MRWSSSSVSVVLWKMEPPSMRPRVSSSELEMLPLCAREISPLLQETTIGWAFSSLLVPWVEYRTWPMPTREGWLSSR